MQEEPDGQYYPAQCECCGCFTPDVRLRHMNTAYVNEESNYTTECDSCFEKTQEYWDEMWREYYGGCL